MYWVKMEGKKDRRMDLFIFLTISLKALFVVDHKAQERLCRIFIIAKL